MGTYYGTSKISRKKWDKDLWTEWKTTPQNHGPSHKLVIKKNKEKTPQPHVYQNDGLAWSLQ